MPTPSHQFSPCFIYYYPQLYQTPLFHFLPTPFYHYAPPLQTFPANGCFYEAAAFVSFDSFLSDQEKKNSVAVKSLKRPQLRSPIPPRLQGVYRSFSADKKLTTLKKEWIPKRITTNSDEFQNSTEENNRTTVMIKNIPNQLRRKFMLEFMDGYCRDYSLEYDFLYLPIDFGNGQNLGYAFVNFTNSVAALKFKGVVDGFKWSSSSRKIIQITWARIQGLESLLRRFGEFNFICYNMDYLLVHLDPPRNGLDPNPRPPVVIGKLKRRYPRVLR